VMKWRRLISDMAYSLSLNHRAAGRRRFTNPACHQAGGLVLGAGLDSSELGWARPARRMPMTSKIKNSTSRCCDRPGHGK
jgi:hypothetical protein